MPKGRKITLFERERIESYLRTKKKKTYIAKMLNRDYSVIKREIKRKGRFYRRTRHNTIKNRVSIDNRKDIVNERRRFGDWETNSVIFSNKHILSVQV